MADPIAEAEASLMDAGYSLDNIPLPMHEEHVWSDGVLLWWYKHGKLPTAGELAEDMFDEWDDPVSVGEAQMALDFITSSKKD